jgi:hypothetical protein
VETDLDTGCWEGEVLFDVCLISTGLVKVIHLLDKGVVETEHIVVRVDVRNCDSLFLDHIELSNARIIHKGTWK